MKTPTRHWPPILFLILFVAMIAAMFVSEPYDPLGDRISRQVKAIEKAPTGQ